MYIRTILSANLDHFNLDQGEALLSLLLHKPAQDDRPDPVLPRGDLQPGRQQVRPPALPLQRAVDLAV